MLPAADHSVITTSTCYKPTSSSSSSVTNHSVIMTPHHHFVAAPDQPLQSNIEFEMKQHFYTFACRDQSRSPFHHRPHNHYDVLEQQQEGEHPCRVNRALGGDTSPGATIKPPTPSYSVSSTCTNLPECGTQDGTSTRVGKFSGLPADIFRAWGRWQKAIFIFSSFLHLPFTLLEHFAGLILMQ